MIRIEQLEGFNSRDVAHIGTLAPLFIGRIRKETLNPEILLNQFLLNEVYDKGGVYHSILNQPIQRAILQYCLDNFVELISEEPTELASRIEFFQNEGWNNIIQNDNSFKLALLDCFGYNRFRGSKRRGVWYAKQLNIKTCPYCNAQYTLYTEHASQQRAKFQFDHFFAKDLYPYLSISMFNLIPSCASCNQSKSSITTTLNSHFHPFHSDLSVSARFRLSYPDDPAKFGLKEILNLSYNELDIHFESRMTDQSVRDYVQRHNELYGIGGIYNRHKDIARELLVKAKLYQGAGSDFLTKIEGLFPDKSAFLHYLLGSYINESEINKRPLSKMVQDIAKQLGLLS